MKKILIGFLALVALLLVIPGFLSAKFSMARSIEIEAPVSAVFARLTDLNEYSKWNPFPEGDPTNQTSIDGLGLGSSLTWKGEKTGEGKMTISKVEPDQRIEVQMEFFKPMKAEGLVQWVTTAQAENKTLLVWSFEQELPYFNRYFGLFMDSMMGPHFERGLKTYKAMVESSK